METAEMENQGAQGVHFATHDEEISPTQSGEPNLHALQTITGKGGTRRDDLNEEAEQELQQLKTTLKNNMQSSRMQHHAFEPVSLPGSQPASRVRIVLSPLASIQD
jgi:hypothetical protein